LARFEFHLRCSTFFGLQTATQLEPATAWSDVTTAPTVVGDENVVVLPITSEKKFYRLFKP